MDDIHLYQANICLAQEIRKPLGADADQAAASFHIRGLWPRGWHPGQKQVPRFFVYVAEYS
ncbi:MAG: hypothetical protein A2Z77_00155 [Chloroflexi bacterium RBG_13_51_36]|nr:MAG: hypothetical protein A2Z77_00155 [Chloroflexi bacterium RBG_13_51_36]